MTNHWAIQVGNSGNFVSYSSESVWVISDKWRTFLANVKVGDKLWFCRKEKPGDLHYGKICAVADFVSKNEVDFNRPLNIKYAGRIVNEGPVCNIEIHYTNLYNLEGLKNLCTGLRRHSGVINCENIKKGFLVNYKEEYERIVYYSQITNSM
jgi:hypothetical protein